MGLLSILLSQHSYYWYIEKLLSFGWGMVSHICNPSYSEDRDWENCSLRPARAKSYREPGASGSHLQS
jgi:hypothetical protein